jgi:hypothetical protein
VRGRVRRGPVRPDVTRSGSATASEQENCGFNVYRSEAENGAYAKPNQELIPGHGTSATSHTYVFADYDVTRGSTYYYKIEEVGVDGSSSLHGPVAVPVGDEISSSRGVIKAASSKAQTHHEAPGRPGRGLRVFGAGARLLKCPARTDPGVLM